MALSSRIPAEPMLTTEKPNERSTLQGTVSRITYQHAETHYTVARLDTDGPSSVTVVGTLFPVSEGEEVKVFGRWKNHPRYGLQFQIDHWEGTPPNSSGQKYPSRLE